jgi:hypothetical protein
LQPGEGERSPACPYQRLHIELRAVGAFPNGLHRIPLAMGAASADASHRNVPFFDLRPSSAEYFRALGTFERHGDLLPVSLLTSPPFSRAAATLNPKLLPPAWGSARGFIANGGDPDHRELRRPRSNPQSRLSAIKVRENPGGRHMRRPMRAAAPWHVNGWSLQSRPKGIDAA